MNSETSGKSPLSARLARGTAFAVACGMLMLAQPPERGAADEQDASAIGSLPADVDVPPPSHPPEILPVLESTVPPIPELPVTPTRTTVDFVVPAVNDEVAPAAAVVPAAAVEVPAVVAEVPAVVAPPFGVRITPGPSRKKDLVLNGRSYQEVYESIPFRRSEYLANPSYRHDATMEILFGQMRPTTIVRNNSAERIENTAPTIARPYLSTPSDYNAYPWHYNVYPGFYPFVTPPLTGFGIPLTF